MRGGNPRERCSARRRSQHAPGRKSFCGYDTLIDKHPSLETEIALIAAYGVPLLGICLNFSEFDDGDRVGCIAELRRRYNVAVAAPLLGELDSIVDAIEGVVAKLTPGRVRP